MRLAIADPPYPPTAAERRDTPGGPTRVYRRSVATRYYGNGTRPRDERPADFHPDAGDYDDPAVHRALLEHLLDTYDGWAIATSAKGIDVYQPLPLPTRRMVWVRPNAIPGGHRIRSMYELVLLYPPEGRRNRLGGQVPDVLTARAPNNGFPGEKPPAWTRWVLDALSYDPETDSLADLFPGTGAVSAAALQGTLL